MGSHVCEEMLQDGDSVSILHQHRGPWEGVVTENLDFIRIPDSIPVLESNLKVFSHPDEVIKALDKHNIVNCQTRDTVAGGGNTRRGGIEQEYVKFYETYLLINTLSFSFCAISNSCPNFKFGVRCTCSFTSQESGVQSLESLKCRDSRV